MLKSRVKGYIQENWGAPFIAAFMLLVIFAAVSLSLNWFSVADSVADYAYLALAAGVVLQLACFLKYRGKSDDEEAL
jgi:hypothetical protein